MIKIRCSKCGREAYSASRDIRCVCGGLYKETREENKKSINIFRSEENGISIKPAW